MERRIDAWRRPLPRDVVVALAGLSALAGCIDPERTLPASDSDAVTEFLIEVDSADDSGAPDAIPDVVASEVAELGDDGGPSIGDAVICTPACDNGDCVAPGRCDCRNGYTGPGCSEPICEAPCANGGRCSAPGVCDCEGTDFQGPRCQEKVCGDKLCPPLPGYQAACNGAAYCEYARALMTEPWHADDVWIHVPPAEFPMGSPEGEPSGGLERPVIDVVVERGYFIGKFEVTTRSHEACEAVLGGCTPPSANDFGANGWEVNRSSKVRHMHPQNGLTSAQGIKVCTFLGGRVPSSAEWELAAKGPKTHRQYPWGNIPAPVCGEHAVFDAGGGYGCGMGGTRFVGPTERSAGRSAVGAFDMAGNVWEWVSDCWHDGYAGAPTDGSAWIDDCVRDAVGPLGMARGGAMSSSNVRSATRMGLSQATRRADVGVRCVRDEL